MTSPLVTAVVPAYNAAKTIQRALDSIFAQDYPALDTVVVDDGSTDTTASIVSSHLSDRLRLVRLPRNMGKSAALNAGVREAKGAYVAFLDADDAWLPGKIERQVALMTRDPSSTFVTCGCTYVRRDGSRQVQPMPSGPDQLGANAWKTLLSDPFVCTPTVLARRDAVLAVGGFNERLPVSEDQDMWIRLARAGPVSAVPGNFVLVYETSGSLTTRYPLGPRDYLLPVIEKHVRACRDSLGWRQRRRILGRRSAATVRYLLSNGYYSAGFALYGRHLAHGFASAKLTGYILNRLWCRSCAALAALVDRFRNSRIAP